MDLLKPKHGGLLQFLKKYLKKEMDDVIDITNIKLTNPTGSFNESYVWAVEVACNDDMYRDNCKYTELCDKLQSLIGLYGEEVDNVIAIRIYVKKNYYV